jgi:hypothetical protein
MGVSGGAGAVQLPAGMDEAVAKVPYYGALSRGWDNVTKTIYWGNAAVELITYEDMMSVCWKTDYGTDNDVNSTLRHYYVRRERFVHGPPA